MDETELRHILAHEYSHYRQGDLLWSVIRGICLSLYWWNPLVWIAAYLSKQDCELSCDEAALKLLGENERLDYGKTLLNLITVKSNPKDYFSVATTMTKGTKSLKRRISMIAHKPRIMISASIVAIFAAVLGFVSTSTAKSNEENDISITSGTYIMEETENELVTTALTIDTDNQTLFFPTDPLSSYLPFCNYEIEKNYIKAKTEDGLYHYTLEILDEETLMFIGNESSEPIVIDDRIFTAPYDGAIFKLSTESFLENASESLSEPESYTKEKILSWFHGTGEPEVDYDAEPVWTEDGVLYYLPVKDKGMYDFRTFLLNYFEEDEVDELLKTKAGDYSPFMEIDGILYRGIGLVGNDTLEDYPVFLSEEKLKELAKKGFNDNAAFYVDEQVGNFHPTEVDFNTFIDYVDTHSTVINHEDEKDFECIFTMKNDTILSIELRNPYAYLSNLSYVEENHSLFENYGTEGYFTLQNTYEAKLNHTVDGSSETDNEMDRIEVYTSNTGDGDSGMVLVYSGYPANNPFSIEAHTTPTGWTNIYYVNVDGKDYIFQLQIENNNEYGECSYYVYSFEEQAGPNLGIVLLEGASFYWDGDVYQDSYNKWTERLNFYLNDAEILLSTQNGWANIVPDKDHN